MIDFKVIENDHMYYKQGDIEMFFEWDQLTVEQQDKLKSLEDDLKFFHEQTSQAINLCLSPS